jgi:hypothetical protein
MRQVIICFGGEVLSKIDMPRLFSDYMGLIGTNCLLILFQFLGYSPQYSDSYRQVLGR